MGANASDPNKNKQTAEILEREIEMYKKGLMFFNSIRFELFSLCASQVIAFHRFYQELSIPQIMQYFKMVQVFDKDEVSVIIQELAEKGGNDNDADAIIRKVLPAILCPYQKSKRDDVVYLSPCCCKELYKDIIKKKYKTSWGTYSPGSLFDFKSQQYVDMREKQENSNFQPKNHHNTDSCFVIFENSLEKLYDQKINEDERPLSFEKPPTKPMMWEKNIHTAATKGSVKSLQYDIYLVPLLRDLQDETGNTPAHLAAKNGEDDALLALRDMNVDFHIFNNNGNLPLHIVKNVKCLDVLVEAGCYLGEQNQQGQTIIEVQSNPFNKEVIEGLFVRGVNILIPNRRGQYWMQIVVHNNFFPAKKDSFVELQKYVRKVLSKLQNPVYSQNGYVQHLLESNVETSETDYTEFLRNAVINCDINSIITYMAFGAHPDTSNSSGDTNLMICSLRGNLDLARIFADNFCDPNKTNNNGENSFWIAAFNHHYDLATLLQKTYFANPDILNNSGQTLMHIAYLENIQELFYFLLNTGASPNVHNSEHETVQFIAFLKRDDEVAEMIQDKYNGDINAKGKNGNTLGHLCIIDHDNERLDYILSRRLNIENKNDAGYTLFMCAIVYLDDLSVCKKLLDLGADINAQDNYGRTPFFYVCEDSKFCRAEFDFLIENKCDINKQTNNRDFPISQLISKDLDEEAHILLSLNANILDPQSPTEPICIAIKKKSKYWLDILISHGANAKNTKYPVIENFLYTSFFSIETLEKMKPLNSTCGAPIQAALKLKLVDAAHYLWNDASGNDRVLISYSRNEDLRIPLIAAMIYNDPYLVDQLTRRGYDVTTTDSLGRSPFIYACIQNNHNWMNNIEQLITLSDMNVVDKDGNSALTFVAVNGETQIADHLFIKGVNVRGINADQNGIIKRYLWILDQYDSILSRAQDNKHKAERIQRETEGHVNKCRNKIHSLESTLNDLKRRQQHERSVEGGNPRQYDGRIREVDSDLRRERSNLADWTRKNIIADEHYRVYKEKYHEIKNASRETMLYNMEHLRNLAEYRPPRF